MGSKIAYLVGVDEAGRGPLAGPVAVGVVAVPIKLKSAIRRYAVRDSKKLSPRDRDQWYRFLNQERRAGNIYFATALVSEKIIDSRGIVPAVRLGIKNCLQRLKLEPGICEIRLDGSLKAPRRFRCQQTIIKGDETEPIIALASIAAKVRRDRRMIRLAELYPEYDFEIHKGYGTAAHYQKLKIHGPCFIHRRSFLKSLDLSGKERRIKN